MLNSVDTCYMKQKQKTMSFQIDPTIREVLDSEAVKQDRSVSWLINYYIRQALEAGNLLPSKVDKQGGGASPP
jgi:predicted transcriptional regulator